MAGSSSGLKPLFIVSDRYHGRGNVIFQWNPASTFICTAGSNGLVHIFDRHGTQVTEIQLENRNPCTAIEWDKDGETVAILQSNTERVAVWELSTRTVTYVDTGLKELTFLKWSKVGPQLAIGSAKGGLIIYRKDSRKKLPITGKHNKAIICGDWNKDNRLALGGQDNILTVSTADGDTIEQTDLKYSPVSVQFAVQKTELSRSSKTSTSSTSPSSTMNSDTTVSVNMGGKSILLYNFNEPDSPVALAFQAKYGKIITYRWFGDGYILIGFSEGYVVVVSTHAKEMGQEIYSGKFFRDTLDDVACSSVAQRAAIAGGSIVRMLDMITWTEIKSEFAQVDNDHGPINSIQWTNDGQILTVATRSGHIYAFLARVPIVVDAYPSLGLVAYLSSLKEVTIVDRNNMDNEINKVTVEFPVEPMMLAVGAKHVGVAVNSRVYYHRIPPSSSSSLNTNSKFPSSTNPNGMLQMIERDYLGAVDNLRIGDNFAAALLDGRLTVHPIENNNSTNNPLVKKLPEQDNNGSRISCFAFAGDYLYYGTNDGILNIFNCKDWAVLSSSVVKLENNIGLKNIFPNILGTRCLLLDNTNRLLLYNPIDNKLLWVPDVPDGVEKVLWDIIDSNCFVVTTGRNAATYVYASITMNGPAITQLGHIMVKGNGDMIVEPKMTPLPADGPPLLVNDGIVTSYTPTNGIVNVTLITHEALHKTGRISVDTLQNAFAQNVSLLRLASAWELASQLNDRPFWLALSGKAMETLDLDLAIRIYRKLGDAAMVTSLNLIAKVEERQALCAHMALLFGDYGLAQDLFLSSSEPKVALDMRKDLLEWETALRLAETLSPNEVPNICLELAKQLEFKNDYSAALQMYQQAQTRLNGIPSSAIDPNDTQRLKDALLGGEARMMLRLGDVRKGTQLALESNNKQLCKDCGAILESMKQYNDAAVLYKRAEAWEKAASLLIASKNFTAAAPLLERTSAPKLHIAYAKAKEAAKEYAEAVKSYEKARDTDSMVRILLDNLKQPEKAAEIVRSTRSSIGAQAVAAFCKSAGDFRGAIEFLLLAKKRDDAFELAATHDEMPLFVQALRTSLSIANVAVVSGDNGNDNGNPTVLLPPEECQRIAGFYEGKNANAAAAELYGEAGQYQRALSLYLKCGESEIPKAIVIAGKAKHEAVTHMLLDYLMGETDGEPKDAKWVFKLYLALGNIPQATKTALIIAEQEQTAGNYKVAHGTLLETYRAVEAVGGRVSRDLMKQLTLLHSYLLVKKLVKAENHEAAARMCVRVSRSISKFPAHIVPILTSTVIECQRAGMKKSAFEYACMLMRPEYRDTVEEKFRKKIEQLVRRPSDEEAVENVSPCPFCSAPVPASDLACDMCKATLPFDICTGRHIAADDVSSCTNCKFPASYTAFTALAQSPEPNCPMCNVLIQPSNVRLLVNDEATVFLQKATGMVSGNDDEKEGSNGTTEGSSSTTDKKSSANT